MSDYIIKIVPKDPFCKISESILKKAKQILESKLLSDSIEIECYDTPEFIDCGGDLEYIICPQCGANLDFDWWGKVMDRAYEKHFISLETETPCCKKVVSLNDLKYHFLCAFACCAIIILNPNCDIGEDIIDSVQKILGTKISIIRGHV